MNSTVAIIPARWASTRFPGKPLKTLKGKPIIVHVIEKALACKTVGRVIVATDDRRIFDAVTSTGYSAQMTSPDHQTGTDRIAEVAKGIDDEIIVNIQGDEPMIDPPSVDRAVNALIKDSGLYVSTLCIPITEEEFQNPDVVKVITDNNGMALYFSRAPIPYNRAGLKELPMKKHLGLYAYRREFLLEYADLKRTELEMAEQLEQLRILQNGVRIKVVTADKDSIGIDTPEDLKRAEVLLDV